MASSELRLREVVVIILGMILVGGLIVVSLQSSRRVGGSGSRGQCTSNLKHIGVAMHFSNDLYKRLPPVNSYYPEANAGAQGTVLYHLLPFLEQQNVWKLNENSDNFTVVAAYKIGVLLCPSDPTLGREKFPPSNYSPNYHVFQNVPGGSQALHGIPDGTSNLIAFGERRAVCLNGGGSWSQRDERYGAWVKNTAPVHSNIEPPDFGDNRHWHEIHAGGINVLMCDGAVFFKSVRTDPKIWQAAVLPDDGVPKDPNW